MLLHIRTGTYLGLDRSASRIVGLLNEDPDPARAARVLTGRFDVPFEQALADVTGVIDAVQSMTARRTGTGRRPTVAGIRVVTRSWRRLSWRLRLATLGVTMVVIGIEAGLLVTDIATLARWMGVPLATDDVTPPPIRPDDLSELTLREQYWYWAVHWVVTRWIFDGTCLRRALALGWFLRRRHPVLRLGMIDHEDTVAHAWIEVDGRAFDAQPVVGAFATGHPPPPAGGPGSPFLPGDSPILEL